MIFCIPHKLTHTPTRKIIGYFVNQAIQGKDCYEGTCYHNIVFSIQ